ncbi:MAG: hypothetical protein K0Q87_3902, partial [Neobacillus sp.]|nr:hypothetical protein [Neobacillus sp.]
NESDASKVGLQETIDDQIKVYTEDGQKQSWLFKGRLKDVNVSIKSGVYILTARFLSETVVLDREQKSRSFQDTNLTYSDIVAIVMEDYQGKSFELTAKKVTIDGPLIQYKETDWQFIKRLASLQEDVLVPDVILDEVVFSFGYPAGGAKTLPDDISYASGKDIASFNNDVESEYKPGLICNEYAYYEVVTYDELTIGDQVTFYGYKLYVGAVTIELKDGILVYYCKLVRYMTLRQNPILNEKFQGVSLEGKVLSVQNQEIKLHLDIDAEQDEETAYWYPFVPPTTDMLYLMPQIGTNASLYIPRLKEQNAIITGCVRNNGESCEKTGDPSTRYLGTEYGQEMRLAPGGIYFTAGRNDLILTFDDEEGVKISSHKEIVIEAKEEIIFDSKQKVAFSSPNQIKMTTPYGGFSMENEIHFADMKTIIECTDESKLPLVEQKLMQENKQLNGLNKPQTTEDAGIDWGGIINAVLGVRVAEASPLEQGDVISSATDDGPTLRADDGTGSAIVRHDTKLEDDGKGVTNVYRTEDSRTIIERSDGSTTYIDSKGKEVQNYNAAGYLTEEENTKEDTKTEYDGTSEKKVIYSSHNGPDYLQGGVSVSWPGVVSGQIAIAVNYINGDIIISDGYAFGKAVTKCSIGASVVAGKMLNRNGQKVNGDVISQYMIGHSTSKGAAFWGVACNVVTADDGTSSVEFGVGTPGFGAGESTGHTPEKWIEKNKNLFKKPLNN